MKVNFSKVFTVNVESSTIMSLRGSPTVAPRFASPNSPLVYLNICRITIEVSIIAQADFVFSYQNKIKRACNNRLA